MSYRWMGRDRKRYLKRYRIFEESSADRTGLRDKRAAFRTRRRQQRAARKADR